MTEEVLHRDSGWRPSWINPKVMKIEPDNDLLGSVRGGGGPAPIGRVTISAETCGDSERRPYQIIPKLTKMVKYVAV